jgi:hypothetical protein
VDGLNAGYGIPEQITYRLVVAYSMLGKQDLTQDIINEWIEKLGAREDQAAQQARAFIAAFKAFLEHGKLPEA